MLQRYKLTRWLADELASIIELTPDGHFIMPDLAPLLMTALAYRCSAIMEYYSNLGLHLIGKWELNDEGNIADTIAFSSMVRIKLLKYYPYLKVLNDEFIAITGDETHEREYENEQNRTENSTDDITKTKTSSTSFSGNGTDRRAEEESPIGSASINSAPTSSTEWNLTSPSKKSGQQYDTSNQSSGSESIDEDRANAVTGRETGEGSDKLTIKNPDKLLKILRFNVENLNLTKIAYMLVDSLVEEKNTIY